MVLCSLAHHNYARWLPVHIYDMEHLPPAVGAVGLTENPTAFRKWMVAGPEQARIIQEFEDTYMTANTNDEGQSAQKSFS